jgi:hypothetical protein
MLVSRVLPVSYRSNDCDDRRDFAQQGKDRTVALRRTHYLLVLTVLALATVLGALASPNVSTLPVAGSATPLTGATPAPMATPAAPGSDLYDAILPDQRHDVIAATNGHLSTYTIEATLVPPGQGSATPASGEGSDSSSLARIDGVLKLHFINDTGTTLTELPFRLNANLRQYDEGRTVIDDITVDGNAVVPQAPPLYSVPPNRGVATPAVADADLILALIPLHSLAPGESVDVSMRFTTWVPVAPPDGTGLFQYHPDTGAWTLGHWYPVLAGYDPNSGWETEPPAAWSDITFANVALYDVTLRAPEQLTIITPGIESSTEVRGGQALHRFVSGPARDFPIVADPTLVVTSAVQQGTTVTVYAPSGGDGGADQILTWTTQALAIYADMFGPYPYTTLDVVAVPGVLGYEFPEMIWLGQEFVADPEGSASRPGATEFLVAHEVAHQWWYGLVGSNPHRYAYLDEGLAEYSAVLYFERQYGVAAAQRQLGEGLTLRYASMLVTSGDAVVDQPTASFPDMVTYYTTVYRKAGLGFAAIREHIGDDSFFTALRSYVSDNRFGVTTPVDLRRALNDSSGKPIDELWHLWLETANGRVEIVMEPASQSPVASPSD